MKLGVIVDCFKTSISEGIKIAKKLGFSGVQIYATQGEFSPQNLTSEKKEYYKKLLHECNLEVSALCGDMGGYGFQIEKDNKDRIEKTKAIIDLAHDFGSKVVTTHIGVIPSDKKEARYKVMLDALTECGIYAMEKGVTLAIETGPENADTLLAFIKDTKGGVGINLDPANFVMVTGQDPVESVYKLKDYIVHTHLKDGKMLNKTDPKIIYDHFACGGIEALNVADYFIETPLGEGDVNFSDYINALNDIGYDGYLTFERETGKDPQADIQLGLDYIKKFNIYMDGLNHDYIIKNTIQELGYNKSNKFKKWKKAIKKKFIELTGLDLIEKNKATDPKFVIEKQEQKQGYKQIRFSFYSEEYVNVPCYLLVPDDIKAGEKRPTVIVLQGHSTGFHNSIGEIIYPEDKEYQEKRGHFAIEAVKEGYIALAIEQRGMGERSARNIKNRRVHLGELPGCYYEQMTGILLGRTLIGERCFDIKCAIDMLANFNDICDLDKVVVTGMSGGGTATYYSACYDERIKIAVPNSAFCPYPQSILNFYHCSCNYIPNAFRYFDMQDLACLIAPRNLVLVNGKKDPSFLIEGARRGFETIKSIYEEVGAKDNCKLIEENVGHDWCKDITWKEIKEGLSKL